jgi:hypothetical protein
LSPGNSRQNIPLSIGFRNVRFSPTRCRRRRYLRSHFRTSPITSPLGSRIIRWRAGGSIHFHLAPVDRVSASELRLSCAVARVGLGAQHNHARIGNAPREKKPLPRSLRAGFHLRLHPRRAVVDADINPVDSTVCPCPSPNLLQCVALERLSRRRRHDDRFRGDRPDRNDLYGVLSSSGGNRIVIPAGGKGTGRSVLFGESNDGSRLLPALSHELLLWCHPGDLNITSPTTFSSASRLRHGS